jgi:hypothetical protein
MLLIMKKNKKAIELSVNFLVIIIISIAMLGMAVLFFNRLMAGANSIQTSYDQQTEQELEALLISGKKVAIPFTRKEVSPGSSVVFGLGILSLGDTKYTIKVVCSKYINEEGTTSDCPIDLPATYPEERTLKNNEPAKIPIAIAIPKNTNVGTYVYNVCVCKCDGCCADCPPDAISELYDDYAHKLYLRVI